MEIYNTNIINLFKIIAKNHTEFFSSCVAVQIGFLAFVAPKLLEINNEIQNISTILFKLFNNDKEYTLFKSYVVTISIFLSLSIIPLLLNTDSIASIILYLIFFIISIIFSASILIKMDYFHNQTIELSKRYKYKTPEQDEGSNKESFNIKLDNKAQNETPNIKWNNRILNLWEQVATYKINQNANSGIILEIVDRGILEFWRNYCGDIEKDKIHTNSLQVFLIDNYIIYPLSRITYLNQVALNNKNSELSYWLIYKLIELYSNTNIYLFSEVEIRINQAILYKIENLCFDDVFDILNIRDFINIKIDKANKNLENELKIELKEIEKEGENINKIINIKRKRCSKTYIKNLESIVNIADNLSKSYKTILLTDKWWKIFPTFLFQEAETSMLQYTNLEILKQFLIKEEYKLIHDYMTYYKNYENKYTSNFDSMQYRLFPLSIFAWNIFLEKIWKMEVEGKTFYTISSECIDLFFLCRLKYYIDLKVHADFYSKAPREEKFAPPTEEKLIYKFNSVKDSLDEFFNNTKLLAPWGLSEKDKEYYKKQMIKDIEKIKK